MNAGTEFERSRNKLRETIDSGLIKVFDGAANGAKYRLERSRTQQIDGKKALSELEDFYDFDKEEIRTGVKSKIKKTSVINLLDKNDVSSNTVQEISHKNKEDIVLKAIEACKDHALTASQMEKKWMEMTETYRSGEYLELALRSEKVATYRSELAREESLLIQKRSSLWIEYKETIDCSKDEKALDHAVNSWKFKDDILLGEISEVLDKRIKALVYLKGALQALHIPDTVISTISSKIQDLSRRATGKAVVPSKKETVSYCYERCIKGKSEIDAIRDERMDIIRELDEKKKGKELQEKFLAGFSSKDGDVSKIAAFVIEPIENKSGEVVKPGGAFVRLPHGEIFSVLFDKSGQIVPGRGIKYTEKLFNSRFRDRELKIAYEREKLTDNDLYVMAFLYNCSGSSFCDWMVNGRLGYDDNPFDNSKGIIDKEGQTLIGIKEKATLNQPLGDTVDLKDVQIGDKNRYYYPVRDDSGKIAYVNVYSTRSVAPIKAFLDGASYDVKTGLDKPLQFILRKSNLHFLIAPDTTNEDEDENSEYIEEEEGERPLSFVNNYEKSARLKAKTIEPVGYETLDKMFVLSLPHENAVRQHDDRKFTTVNQKFVDMMYADYLLITVIEKSDYSNEELYKMAFIKLFADSFVYDIEEYRKMDVRRKDKNSMRRITNAEDTITMVDNSEPEVQTVSSEGKKLEVVYEKKWIIKGMKAVKKYRSDRNPGYYKPNDSKYSFDYDEVNSVMRFFKPLKKADGVSYEVYLLDRLILIKSKIAGISIVISGSENYYEG